MRRLLAICLIAATICLLIPAVYAEEEPVIVPFAEVCGVCNRGVLFSTYGNWGPWLYTGQKRPCNIDSRLFDLHQGRIRWVEVRCNYCGDRASYDESQFRWLCSHR